MLPIFRHKLLPKHAARIVSPLPPIHQVGLPIHLGTDAVGCPRSRVLWRRGGFRRHPTTTLQVSPPSHWLQ
jgi:hypothetical protein